MDENLHDIDKLFRDPIEEHEEMPSAKVWDAIDNNFDKSNVISIKKKYNNLKRLAVALLLLLLGTIAYEIQTKKSDGKGVVINNTGTDKSISSGSENAVSNKYKKKNVNNTAVNSAKDEEGSTTNNFTTNNAIKNLDENKSTLTVPADKRKVSNSSTYTTHNGIKNANDKKTASIVRTVNGAVSDALKSKRGVIKNKVDRNASTNRNDANLASSENAKKSSFKKGSQNKTKITIQNAEAEDLTNENNKLTIEEKNIPAPINELMPLQKDKIDMIISEAIGKAKGLKTINSDRNTAEVSIKTIRSKNNKAPKPFHFSLTPFFSPQLSFNRLEDDHHDAGPQPRNGREQIKQEEQRQLSSAMGVLFDISIGKNWGLQSGITYVKKETEIEPKKIFAKMDIDGKVKYRFDCASGYTYISPKTGTTPIVGDSVNAAASTNTLKYIGVPFALTYNFSLGKFNIVPTFGAVANFLIKQQIETEIVQGASKEKQTINTIQGLKPTYFNAYTGLAVEYNINKMIALTVMPSCNFALGSINKDAAVKSYPNSFGLTGGIKIKF